MNLGFGRAGVLFILTFLSTQMAFARPRLFVIHAPAGAYVFEPIDISADGRVITGTATLKNELGQAYRVTGHHQLKRIATSLPVESIGVAVSADGSVILGNTYNAANVSRAFLWTKQTGAIDLSADPDLSIFASGLSGNGQVAFGYYVTPIDEYPPFVWSADTGFQFLSISNYDSGFAGGINYDGNVIVGYLHKGFNYACRWVNRGEPQLLDPQGRDSYAAAVTPDGSVIVGVLTDNGVPHPFRWTRFDGLELLPTDESFREITISDISADGQRIVGYVGRTNLVFIPVLWTADEGPRDLNDAFPSVLPRGWRFAYATTISADGRWIAGDLVNTNGRLRGYVLDTGRPR